MSEPRHPTVAYRHDSREPDEQLARAREFQRLMAARRTVRNISPAPVARERSMLLQGLEKAAASLVAVAVKRLGERGLDQLLSEASHPAPAPGAAGLTAR